MEKEQFTACRKITALSIDSISGNDKSTTLQYITASTEYEKSYSSESSKDTIGTTGFTALESTRGTLKKEPNDFSNSANGTLENDAGSALKQRGSLNKTDTNCNSGSICIANQNETEGSLESINGTYQILGGDGGLNKSENIIANQNETNTFKEPGSGTPQNETGSFGEANTDTVAHETVSTLESAGVPVKYGTTVNEEFGANTTGSSTISGLGSTVTLTDNNIINVTSFGPHSVGTQKNNSNIPNVTTFGSLSSTNNESIIPVTIASQGSNFVSPEYMDSSKR